MHSLALPHEGSDFFRRSLYEDLVSCMQRIRHFHPVRPHVILACLAGSVFLALLLLPLVVMGQVPAPGDTGSTADLEQLAEKSYSKRQEATREMWRHRELSRDEVQAASRDNDPEVASRAQWILRQWRRGALPDTPPDISRILGRTDDPSAIDELLDAGQFSAAVVAVEESAGTADRDAVRMRVVVALQRRFAIFAVQARRDGTLGDLLKLVDLVADSKEMAVTRIELMRLLGIEFDESSLLPKSSETWSAALRDQARVLVHTVNGNHDAAIVAAMESRQKPLLRTARLLAQQYTELATEGAQAARAAEVGSIEQTRLWCDVLTAADRARLDELRTEAIEALRSETAAVDESAVSLRWKSLAIHGEVDMAIELLAASKPATAAMLAVASSRTKRGMELLGIDKEPTSEQLGDLVQQAIDAQSRIETRELSDEFENALAATRLFLSIGRSDLAWTIVDKLARNEIQIGIESMRSIVLSTLSYSTRDDWMFRLAVLPGETSVSGNVQDAIFQVLPDATQGTLKMLIDALTRLDPASPFDQRFRAACQLMSGDLPLNWDRSTDFKRLHDYLTAGKREIQRVGGQVVVAARPQLSLGLVNLFSLHGENDLANDLLQRMVGLGDVQAAFELAENQLLGGRVRTTETLYDSIWDAVARERSGARSSGISVGSEMAVKALIAKWMLAKRTTDFEAEQTLLQEIRLALCSPSTALRLEAAQYLAKHSELSLATEVYSTLLPMTALGTREGTPLYSVANSYAFMVEDSDVASGAMWMDVAVTSLPELLFREFAYITWPSRVERWKLQASVKESDNESASHHLQRITQLNPLDINTAELVFPKMTSPEQKVLAEQTLSEMLDRGQEYLQAFPLDITLHNNLAWVAAINNTALPLAKNWSRRAVYLEPDSAVYRDTLAEVLYRLGESQQAVIIEQACLLDEPGEWHLHEQVRRFKDGKP